MLRFYWLTLILYLGLSIQAPATQANDLKLERSRTLVVTGIAKNTDISVSRMIEGSGLVYVRQFDTADTDFLRLRFNFDRLANPATGWRIEILTPSQDGEFEVAWMIDAGSIRENVFWTREIIGNLVRVELVVDSDDISPILTIDQTVRSIQPTIPESIVGPDNRQPFNIFPDEIKTLGKSIANIKFVGDDGKVYNCTGFLLATDLLLTNEHCINSESERQSAYAIFDYDEPAAVETIFGMSELVAHNYKLDYSLIRLSEATDREPLVLSNSALTADEELLIIQHPAGEPKQVSFKDCKVNAITMIGRGFTNTDFSHTCDTLGGSSGSPVIRVNGLEVIGLHHLGFDEETSALLNRAVYIEKVIEDIKAVGVEGI